MRTLRPRAVPRRQEREEYEDAVLSSARGSQRQPPGHDVNLLEDDKDCEEGEQYVYSATGARLGTMKTAEQFENPAHELTPDPLRGGIGHFLRVATPQEPVRRRSSFGNTRTGCQNQRCSLTKHRLDRYANPNLNANPNLTRITGAGGWDRNISCTAVDRESPLTKSEDAKLGNPTLQVLIAESN